MRKTAFMSSTIALLLSLVFVPAASAADELAEFKAKASARLHEVNPRFVVGSVEKAQLQGFYKVQLENGPLLYMAADTRYFFDGSLYQLADKKLVNLTNLDADKQRGELVKELDPKEMIVFSPTEPVKTKAHINVFTDVDCGFCRKLHKEVPELNARGIEVRYMAFPRAGIGSPSYDKIVSAWCSDNPQEALTKLKQGEPVEPKTCDNPVAKQYELGRRMGVTGTPAIILEDGTLIPGYRPAEDLAKMLGI